MTFVPSEHNLKIASIALESKSNIICRACAGSGKTTQLKFLAQKLQGSKDLENAEFLAFNSRNAAALERCLPKGIQSSTTHQFMLRVLREHFGFEINLGKNWAILRELIPTDSPDWKLRKRIVDLTSRAKAEGLTHDQETQIADLIDRYGLPAGESAAAIVGYTKKLLEKSKNVTEYGVDFDDMLYLPIILNLPLPHRSLVSVDECQDFSTVQIKMLQRLVDNDTRIFAVGDPFQSIYGFRGARSDSFQQVQAILENSKRTCEIGILPVSYRMDKENIKFANGFLPAQDMQARQDAGVGLVTNHLTQDDLVADIQNGDIVECRHWAPIMKIRYKLWEKRKRCVIMGDSGEQTALLNHAKELSVGTKSNAELISKIVDWESSLDSVLTGWQLDQSKDVAQCLKTIAAHTDGTTKSLLWEINGLYCKPAPGIEKFAILLGTIHSFKGDEANRVWRLTSKVATSRNDEDARQEANCDYVAATRGKNEYHIIPGEV